MFSISVILLGTNSSRARLACPWLHEHGRQGQSEAMVDPARQQGEEGVFGVLGAWYWVLLGEDKMERNGAMRWRENMVESEGKSER